MASATLAMEVIDALHAVLGSSGIAGIRQALVDVTLAALTHEARWAGAAVATHLIHTGAVVEALGAPRDGVDRGVTVIHVDLTVHTLCATGAGALVGISEVDAGAAVLARVG